VGLWCCVTSRQVVCQTEGARSLPVSSEHISEAGTSLRSQRSRPEIARLLRNRQHALAEERDADVHDCFPAFCPVVLVEVFSSASLINAISSAFRCCA